ncbi:MAG: tetratricopeptide repeat protein [Deltaproteobacteria bacterium]|nr:MAG: tetratricopeptide repeat protein [Deltaproteobacteria bacterium]
MMCALWARADAQGAHPWLREGDRAYLSGDYPAAEEAYRKALEAEPDNAQARYNLGNALYQQGRLEEAAKEYEGAARSATQNEVAARAWHNLGNTFFRLEELEKSIEAYKQALRRNPHDFDTKKNLSAALQLLKQQQQQQQQQNEQQQNQNQNQQQDQQEGGGESQSPQQQDQNQSQGNPQEERQNQADNAGNPQQQEQQGQSAEAQPQGQPQDLTREEARKLLEIMSREEQKVLEKLRKGTGRKGRPSKDW